MRRMILALLAVVVFSCTIFGAISYAVAPKSLGSAGLRGVSPYLVGGCIMKKN